MKGDEFLRKQLKVLNRHLPKGRVPLSELLRRDKPRVETRSGGIHRFRKSELKYLAELLPKELHSKLRLPIFIGLMPQLGRGAARISGKIECMVVNKVLKREKEKENELVIYRPEVRALRRKLQTTTQYTLLATLGE
ncbi:MAG: DUF61 family protein [Candidatus Hadarchaeota archaeon]|nr:DUF61 family protein [Candidatus Hadarchaeota archaeon]